MFFLFTCAGVVRALDYAGLTAATATVVEDQVVLKVQDGGNFVKLQPQHLPATIVYLPDTAFGPRPAAIVGLDTLPMQMAFDDCRMQWQWDVTSNEGTKIVNIAVHENAIIEVHPYVCVPTASDTAATICDYDGGLQWGGALRTEEGDYSITLTNAAGCDSVRTLHLTITTCTPLDTVYSYFCSGSGTSVIVRDGDVIRCHTPYVYQSPATWDYKKNAIIAKSSEHTVLSLIQIEANLAEHYPSTGPLTPLKSIAWQVRYPGETNFHTLQKTGDYEQYFDVGSVVRINVTFDCGESFTEDIVIDWEEAIENEFVRAPAQKVIMNSTVVILRGGKRYSVLGTVMK